MSNTRTDLEDPDNAENNSNHNTDYFKAFGADPLPDFWVVTSAAAHALIERSQFTVEEGPDEVNPNTHVGKGIDSD